VKKLILFIFSAGLFFSAGMETRAKNVLESYWRNVVWGECDDQGSDWWSSAEAMRIAENVLLYQKDIGGWPKNIQMQRMLTREQKSTLIAAKPGNRDCTIDNGAVSLELTYLSKVYAAISDSVLKVRIREGFLKGIQYILEAQYDNGGWPQFYPLTGGYSDYITYNDNAMVNVMTILKHIYERDGELSIVPGDSTIAAAEKAFNKGVECILNTQYLQEGVPTAWCAQYDNRTLQPVPARSYELVSLSGGESEGIISLLMSIDHPSHEIRRAIYFAVSWYDRVRIKGYRVERFINSDGFFDKRVVADAEAPDMWARFYTLENNTPFFCDRDGIKKYSPAEIGYERRNGYSWYTYSGEKVLEEYKTWYQKWGNDTERDTIINSSAKDAGN
jgi:pectinesterase